MAKKKLEKSYQNKRRHKTMQQQRKKQSLLSDLSACITCLLTLGLLIPAKSYVFGYE